MSDYKIAIKIAGQLESSFNSAISGAQKGLSGLGLLGKAGSASLKIAAGALTATAAAMGGVAIASIKTGQEFDSAMSSAAATAGATAEEYAKMEKAAMEMGRTTSKTATESANALEYMSLAGWDVDTSIAALPSVLKLSEATGLDLARTSDLVTDSMAAAGVSVDNLSNYLDVCAKAQNSSNQTAEQMMEAFIGVGGTMKGLGVDTRDTATALGVMANRGIKGSEAGTALNAIMTNLTTGTGQAGKMMESLGISAFDSQGNFIGLEATLQAVNEATAGLSQEERNAALAAIGGKTHVDALNALLGGLNDTTEEGVSEWSDLAESLYNCDGAMEEMRDIKMDNLAGDMATFKSAVQDAEIKISKNLTPALRNLAQYGTEQIYRLSDALEEGGFSGMAEELGNVLADAAMNITEQAPQFVSAGIGLINTFMGSLRENAPALGTSAATLASSIITGFLSFYGNFWATGAALLASFLQGMVALMPSIIQSGVDAVTNLSEGITSQFPSIVQSAIQIILYLISGIGQMLPILITMGAQLVIQLAQGLANNIPQLVITALQAILAVIQAIVATLPSLVSAGLQLASSVGQGILSGLAYLFTGGVQMILQLISGLLSSLPALIAQAGQVVLGFLNGLVALLPVIVQGGVALILGLIQGIIQNLPQILSTAINVVMTLLNGIVQALPTILAAGIALITQLLQGIVQMLPQVISMGINAVVQLLVGIAQALPQILSTGIAMIQQLITGIVNALPLVLQAAIQGVVAFIQGIGSNMGNIVSSGIQIIVALATGLIQAIPLAISAIPQLVVGIVSAIFETDWIQVGADMISGIASGFMSGFTSLVDSVKGMWSDFTSWLFGDGGDAAADYNAQDIPGYTQTMNHTYTNDNGETYYTAQELAAQGVAGASDVVAYQNAGAEAAQAYNTGLATGETAATETAQTTAQAVQEKYQLDPALLAQLGIDANTSLAEGIDASKYLTETAADGTGTDLINALNNSLLTGEGTIDTTALGLGETSIESILAGMNAEIPSMDATSMLAGTALTDGMGSGIATGTAGLEEQISALGLMASDALNTSITDSLPTVNAAALASGTEITNGITDGIDTGMSSATESATSASTETIAAMAEGISASAETITTTISTLSTSISESLTTCWSNVSTSTGTAWSEISATVSTTVSTVTSTVSSGMSQLVSAVQNGCNQAVAACRSAASQIQSAFAGINLYSAGVNMMAGLENGIRAKGASVIAAAQSIASQAAAAVNSALQVHSPSRLMIKTGEFVDEGLIRGMEGMSDSVQKAAVANVSQPVADQADAIRSIQTPDSITAKSAVIGETIGTLSGEGSGSVGNDKNASEVMPKIVFSPTYHFEGDAPSKDDLVEANRMSMAEFEKMMKEYLRKNKRVAFA